MSPVARVAASTRAATFIRSPKVRRMTGPEMEGRLLEALERWRNQRVAVRVVAGANELVAVFVGTLRARVDEKHPALFWPVELGQGVSAGLERPGVYVHRELLTEVRVHVGQLVVEYVQAGVTVNVRRLGPTRGRVTRS